MMSSNNWGANNNASKNYNNVNSNRGNKNVNIKEYNTITDWYKYAQEIMEEEKSITTNQLRNILSLFVSLKNEFDKTENDILSEEELDRLKYLRIKLIYQIAREGNNVFLKKSHLEKRIDTINTKKGYKKLLEYVEAIVAYNKFYSNK